MTTLFQLRTPRLLLRRWCLEDYPQFAQLNADEEVMHYFPAPLQRAESDALADRISTTMAEQGWGLWAVESRAQGNFLGFIGLSRNAVTPRGDIIEVGWRLQRESWGQGFATEGAAAALVFAFEMLKLAEVYSFTSTINDRSRAVMERVGMVNTGENFMHPKLADDSPLCEHVLYRVGASQFNTEMPVEVEALVD